MPNNRRGSHGGKESKLSARRDMLLKKQGAAGGGKKKYGKGKYAVKQTGKGAHKTARQLLRDQRRKNEDFLHSYFSAAQHRPATLT